jgi:hypothetical protein
MRAPAFVRYVNPRRWSRRAPAGISTKKWPDAGMYVQS